MNKRRIRKRRIILPLIGVVVMSCLFLLSITWLFIVTAQPIDQGESVLATYDEMTEITTTTVTPTENTSTSTTTTTTVVVTTTTTSTTEETTTTETNDYSLETPEEEIETCYEAMLDLSDLYISMDMNLNDTTGLSKEQFIALMNDFSCDYNGLFGRNSETIWDLCQEYNINEVFFVSLIGAESHWGSNEAHIATCNYTSIQPEGYLIQYSSEYEGLTASAALIGNKYFNDVGTTLYSISQVYCPDDPNTFEDESQYWTDLVYDCMNLVVSDIQSQS